MLGCRMMIFWRGYGFLVAIIGIAALALTRNISEKITGDKHFYLHHGWVFLIGMIVAAALTYGLHKLLLREKERVLIDKETGGEVVLASNHSLFFVPVQLWPPIFIVIGIVFAVVPPQTSTRHGVAADGKSVAGQK
jgi:hypothetical protein